MQMVEVGVGFREGGDLSRIVVIAVDEDHRRIGLRKYLQRIVCANALGSKISSAHQHIGIAAGGQQCVCGRPVSMEI